MKYLLINHNMKNIRLKKWDGQGKTKSEELANKKLIDRIESYN